MPRYIDADKLLARYKERCEGCKETKNYCEHCCDIADVISDIEDTPTIWHKVKSEKDLPELCVPVIVEYDRGITVAILDDAWGRNQLTWYVNNFPIGLWNAVDRWMEIPR